MSESVVSRTVAAPFQCTGCGEKGEGKFVNLNGAKYHAGCVKCSVCAAKISGEMTLIEGKIACVACGQKRIATTTVAGGRIGGIRFDHKTRTVYKAGPGTVTTTTTTVGDKSTTTVEKKGGFCTGCGAKQVAGQKFCAECGAKQ